MMFISVLAIVLSFLLAAAHLFRGGHIFLAVIPLLLPLFLLIQERWAARVMQLALGIAAIEWGRTSVSVALERITAEQPYVRVVLILGGVMVVTAFSALAFHFPALKRRYKPALRKIEQGKNDG